MHALRHSTVGAEENQTGKMVWFAYPGISLSKRFLMRLAVATVLLSTLSTTLDAKKACASGFKGN